MGNCEISSKRNMYIYISGRAFIWGDYSVHAILRVYSILYINNGISVLCLQAIVGFSYFGTISESLLNIFLFDEQIPSKRAKEE